MKAQSLSVCVPNKGCNKSCKYCVSKMTGLFPDDWETVQINLSKVIKFADRACISNVIVTGKGEPTVSSVFDDTLFLIEKFSEEFPVELQTNGIELRRDSSLVMELWDAGLNTVALSVDSIEEMNSFRDTIARIKSIGMTSRVTVCVSDAIEAETPTLFITTAKELGVDQLSFRRLAIPKGAENTFEGKWIKANTQTAEEFFNMLMREIEKRGFLIRRLPYGTLLYDIEGIGLTWLDECIQESHGEDDIRSLIFMNDGHLYTHWGRRASRIF